MTTIDEIQPWGDRVLVSPAQARAVTPSGIIIPPQAQEPVQTGTILAVGDEQEHASLQPGTEVIYARHGGIEFALGGERYILLNPIDILGVVTPA